MATRPEQKRSVAAPLTLVVGDAAVLAGTWPDPAALRQATAHPSAWCAAVGADRAASVVVGGALWMVALWLAVGLLAAVVACLPGAAGRAAGGLSDLLLPVVVQRAIAAVAGAGVLLAPIAASAHTGGIGRSQQYTPSSTSASAPSIPAPGWPTDGPPTGSPTAPAPPARTGPGGTTTPTPPTAGPARNRPVVVRPGDSLWLIAARRLGPAATTTQISAQWPRWYAANRARIGSDPDVIHPGEALQPPPPGHGATLTDGPEDSR